MKAPDEAVGFEAAVRGGRKLGAVGRPKAGEEKVLTEPFKRGEGKDYILARLERDRPDILNESPDVVRLVDGEVGAMPTLSEAMTGNSNANKNSVDNIKAVSCSPTKGGTDPTYLLARMKGEPTRI